MNKIELLVYNVLKSNPRIKYLVRNLYQSVLDIFPKKADSCEGELVVHSGYFFGFHDVSPFSVDNTFLLANQLTIPLRMPTIEDNLNIGVFKNEDYSEYIQLGSTNAWNYHKGCRLQWIGESNDLIFNVYENSLKSKIINIHTLESKIIDWPIDSVSSNGIYATSFSYKRLEKLMPGYGYLFDDNGFLDDNTPNETGLFLIDLKENCRFLLLSLMEISSVQQSDNMNGAMHFVTHTSFSPDSKYVSFLHRWVKDDMTKMRTRLIVCDINSKEIYISPTDEMVSHYVWNKKGNIIAYCCINSIDSHILFSDFTMNEYKRVGYPMLNSDGHQHFNPDGNLFITDTYPDKWRISRLFIVDTITQKVRQIASLNSPKKFQSILPHKHWACDLHPRWSRENNMVCFDSVHKGERSLCILKINSSKNL